MPLRGDISKILIIGSGPIVIGQACEFDYSGSQACKVLRELGYQVALVNSNPATIMTDPEFADRTYIEPIDAETVVKVIERESPDAVLPTLGGQTALNVSMDLHRMGAFEEFGVELIGASPQAIETAESREKFKEAMQDIGLELPRSGFASNIEEAVQVAAEIGFPLMLRPSFILGGGGTALVFDMDEFRDKAAYGLAASPISQLLIEESVLGWKEYELEVMRDLADNVVIICSIENFDPMGVHTGDSITVAPAQTLTDREYQVMRDAAIRVIRRIGVDTGGSNIQFAVNPDDGRMVVIEMNPRVSRSSALASKATGFPIAKIAAQLAVGLTLDEIPNDITKKTPASFEPTIDYVVVKIPRWVFEKFPGSSDTLGTQMMSVGEAMAIGRTFPEALQKALRSLENGTGGLGFDGEENRFEGVETDSLLSRVGRPTPDRILELGELCRRGAPVDQLAAATGIDSWFLDQMQMITTAGIRAQGFSNLAEMPAEVLRDMKRLGFSDPQLARMLQADPEAVRARRAELGLRPTFKTVDTCGAEFEASTPYYYSTYEDEDEVAPSDREKVMILGAGPNRIGQGIEFDYCCVHAAYALRDAGFETIMVNCNPETVSTDYDTSDRLYFEPLTVEDVLNIVEAEKPTGVIVQLGGQTPLKLADALASAGAPVVGTSPDSIDMAEDRERFGDICNELGIPQPPNATASTIEGALEATRKVGYPALVRPSYVLGGRAMEIVYSDDDLKRYMTDAISASRRHDEAGASEDRPVLIDRFLEDAIEVDVDALFDGEEVLIGGIMEHIEEAGIHSGDSACVLPPMTLSPLVLDSIEAHTVALARALSVRGLLNVQYAVKDGEVFVIEANPRASRTVPFVAKATGVPLAKAAARIMMGATIQELRTEGLITEPRRGHVSVKEAVLPFGRFLDSDAILGPEMRSTGEAMGIAANFGIAFAKAQSAAGSELPRGGAVFISVRDRDKRAAVPIARRLLQLGFEVYATEGTSGALTEAGITSSVVAKVGAGEESPVDLVNDGKIGLVINTPAGRGPRADGYLLRKAAQINKIPCITTVSGAEAAVAGIAAMARSEAGARSLQEYHGLPDQLNLFDKATGRASEATQGM